VRYIARDDQTIARRFGERIISSVEKITAFPRSGRMVPEQRNDLIREIILSPYRIIFQIDDAALRINVMKNLALCERKPELRPVAAFTYSYSH